MHHVKQSLKLRAVTNSCKDLSSLIKEAEMDHVFAMAHHANSTESDSSRERNRKRFNMQFDTEYNRMAKCSRHLAVYMKVVGSTLISV